MDYPVKLLQWRKKKTGKSYEAIANEAGLSLSTAWDIIQGNIDPSASSLRKLFIGMGLDTKHALNPDLKEESQFRRAVVRPAR